MNTADRLALILERLTSAGRVQVAELRETLGVSEMTIRRDLIRLEDDGALRRVRGGATRALGGSYEPPFMVRSRQRIAEKEAIAREVAAEIVNGDTVLLDGGTTGLAIAHALLDKVITVCPLSLRIAGVLVNSPTIRMLLPGGFVRPGEQSLIGADVIESLRHHVFDLFVMTASGMSTRTGFTEWNEDDAAVKRTGLASARRCIVACDSSKFGESAFARVADLGEIDLIVTDAGLSTEAQREVQAVGAPVRVAATAGSAPAEARLVDRSP
jgi:DeoR/GlpR family transcriptional regulator of sugar metabolism